MDPYHFILLLYDCYWRDREKLAGTLRAAVPHGYKKTFGNKCKRLQNEGDLKLISVEQLF